MRETDRALAHAIGFAESVAALRRALPTAPAGWLLTVWMCWGRIPAAALASWLGAAAMVWGGSLWSLMRTRAGDPNLGQDRRRVHWIAALHGCVWGMLAWVAIGYDPMLDAVCMALLCGIVSINMQVYRSYVPAFYLQTGLLWALSIAGLLHADDEGAFDVAVGLSVFIAIAAYYASAASKRLLEAMLLQHLHLSSTAPLQAALLEAQRDAATDPLTGQWNRRALDDFFKQQFDGSGTAGNVMSVLMIDIDFFKLVNDAFGHMVGDEVLRAFARRLRDFVRDGDFCARYGGEEFVIVLPGRSLDFAKEVANRVCAGIAASPILDEPRVSVTVSIGAAEWEPGQTPDVLLSTADAALYLAKHGGRSQVRSCQASRKRAIA